MEKKKIGKKLKKLNPKSNVFKPEMYNSIEFKGIKMCEAGSVVFDNQPESFQYSSSDGDSSDNSIENKPSLFSESSYFNSPDVNTIPLPKFI